ncbi:MAG: chromate transporter [Clostridiales bacterium]|nr:chromate transporter [Clostridiales bacterium]
MIYLILFFEFFKIGLFSVGGGLATLPFLYNLADRYDWFTRTDLIDMIAISESTPGPIGVNMATYAGYNAAGVLGGIVATLGIVVPALLVIISIAKILSKFKDNKYVDSAFYGIRPAVAALILASAWDVIESTLINVSQKKIAYFNIPAIICFALIYFLLVKYKKHPILYIGLAALIGIFVSF